MSDSYYDDVGNNFENNNSGGGSSSNLNLKPPPKIFKNNNNNNNDNNSNSERDENNEEEFFLNEPSVDDENLNNNNNNNRNSLKTRGKKLAKNIPLYSRAKLKNSGVPFIVFSSNNSEEKSDFEIYSAECYKKSILRTFLFILGSIISFGFLFIVTKTADNIYAYFAYVSCTPDDAEYILIRKSEEENFNLVKVKKIEQTTSMGRIICRYFIYRLARFVWFEDKKQFIRHQYSINYSLSEAHSIATNGLSEDEVKERKLWYGSNAIKIAVPSFLSIILKEITHPFYIFQVFSCILWAYDDYLVYSSFVIILSTVSLFVEAIYQHRNRTKLAELAKHNSTVVVTRIVNDEPAIIKIHCSKIVPGDVVHITEEMEITCDMILISGECVINESMLTGESAPVVKRALPNSNTIYSSDTHKNGTLFCGTKVLQVRQYQQGEVVKAVVIRTGYSTMKGMLFRSILHPKPIKYKLYRDTYIFIALMVAIGTTSAIFLAIKMAYDKMILSKIFIKAVELISVSVPPELPIIVNTGLVIAMTRLKANRIYSIEPGRIANFAGKLNVICFDKTGTLTEDSLEFEEIRTVNATKNDDCFEEPIKAEKIVFTNKQILRILASCHGLSVLKGVNLSGHPVDIKMFSITSWTFEDPQVRFGTSAHAVKSILIPPTGIKGNIQYEASDEFIDRLGILHRFEFEPKLQRMSTIVMNLETGDLFLCTKGSPEVIASLSNRETVPLDFEQVLTDYTINGRYVLACAFKKLDKSVGEQVSFSREELEKDLNFSGLMVLSNKLKIDSKPTIDALMNALIRPIIITGDNALTAITVAKQLQMIPEQRKILLAEMINNQLTFYNMDDRNKSIDLKTFNKILGDHETKDIELNIPDLVNQDERNMGLTQFNLVITGKALAQLTSHPNRKEIVRKTVIWARVLPDQKTQIVEDLIDLKYTVGMCGDGTNDCGALKAAHVGLALSDAEASIVAPFTSRDKTVSSFVTLIIEGRGALANSMGIFQFLIIYPLIQLYSILIDRMLRADFSNTQYLYSDCLILLPLFFILYLTEPTDTLTKAKPPSSILAPRNVFSVVGQAIITFSFQCLALLIASYQPWYCSPINRPFWCSVDYFTDESYAIHSYETTTLWNITNFQYTIVALSVIASRPLCKPFYTNILFVLHSIVTVAISISFLLMPSEKFRLLFDLMFLPYDFRTMLLVLIGVHLFASLVWSRVIVNGFIGDFIERVTQFKKRSKSKVSKKISNQWGNTILDNEEEGNEMQMFSMPDYVPPEKKPPSKSDIEHEW